MKSLSEPDPLRLRYRDEIRAMMRDIVVEGRADISEYVASDTAPDALAQLQEIVDAEVANLHEGSALRFGIRRGLFEAWLKRRNG